MSSAKQNHSIARLIVGAMSIDGILDKSEQQKVARALEDLGMAELIADVGAAIEEDSGDFNMFTECQELLDSLGVIAYEVSPLIFRIVADVVASDHFVSQRELSYLSALAKKLGLSSEEAKGAFKQVLADRKARIEISAKDVDAGINPYLKDLLNFSGADLLVGHSADIYEEDNRTGISSISHEDVNRALAILGLEVDADLKQVEAVWRETIDNLELPKMADLGETFVSAALHRITRINEAYKVILQHSKEDKESSL